MPRTRPRTRNLEVAQDPWALPTVRIAQGLSQAELGRRLYVELQPNALPLSPRSHQNLISSWETGKARPNAVQLAALAKVLGIEPFRLERWFESLEPNSQLLIHIESAARQEFPALFVFYVVGPIPKRSQPLAMAIRRAVDRSMCIAFASPCSLQPTVDKDGRESLGTTALSLARFLGEFLPSERFRRQLAVFEMGHGAISDLDPVAVTHVISYEWRADLNNIYSTVGAWHNTPSSEDFLFLEIDVREVTKGWQRHLSPIFDSWRRGRYRSFHAPNESSFWKRTELPRIRELPDRQTQEELSETPLDGLSVPPPRKRKGLEH